MQTSRALVPEDLQNGRRERRSWSRAITAYALASSERGSPEKILRANWPHDPRAQAILKAAVSPTSTADFPAQDTIAAFRSLAPGSAAWKLFDHPSALRLDLRGVRSITIPHVANFPSQPVFIAEGAPGPVVQWSLMKSAVGPVRKIMVLSAVSEELESASPQSVSAVIGRVLADAVNKSIDAIAFDSNPGTAIRPPGLLFGVTPLTATSGTDQAQNMFTDLGNLVGAIGAAGIDPSEAVLIASPREAMSLILRAGAQFNSTVLMSLGVPDKTIIAAAPAGIASGYQGPPAIDTSKEAVLHREGASPGEIVSSPGVVAAPSTSIFQSYLLAIRVRAEAAWAAAPGAVQVTNTVNW
jgi:hypothetical protein